MMEKEYYKKENEGNRRFQRRENNRDNRYERENRYERGERSYNRERKEDSGRNFNRYSNRETGENTEQRREYRNSRGRDDFRREDFRREGRRPFIRRENTDGPERRVSGPYRREYRENTVRNDGPETRRYTRREHAPDREQNQEYRGKREYRKETGREENTFGKRRVEMPYRKKPVQRPEGMDAAGRAELQQKHYSKKKQLTHRLKKADEEKELRLNRYISMGGVCSRRDADALITEGRVKVNGEVVQTVGIKVKRTDRVEVDDTVVTPERKVYLVLNKPKDYVTTVEDPLERKTVMTLIEGACKERIYPIGRLDRNTTGVLLFTNDGDLAKKLTHPKYEHKKIYHVFLDKPLETSDMESIAGGMELEDGFIKADEISYVSTDRSEVGIEIHSGRNRIVRRIFEHLGYQIVRLDRVYFAGITKKNLPRGRWRFLTPEEVKFLKIYRV